MDFRDIKERREALGLTLGQLASKCHNRISPQLLNMIERGNRNLTSDKALILGEVLNCEPFQLALSQTLSNQGISLKDRETAVDLLFDDFRRLLTLKSEELEKRKDLDFGDRDTFARSKKLSKPEAKKSKDNGEIKRNSVCAILTEKRTVTFYNERYDRNVPKIVNVKTARFLRKTGLFKFEKMRDENQRSDQKG
ncbi:MAG: helix-turn-helix transcriptional regulator [Actinobacteria bacterium]|nr:helix-turn-helix transcriptional regulator [Actinomycetota bacterium]